MVIRVLGSFLAYVLPVFAITLFILACAALTGGVGPFRYAAL